jgi:soluble lytic murein transglycosylase-like protein
MKLPLCILASLCLFSFVFCSTARSGIYAYIASDGSVNLSNVPADGRYTMLVAEPQPEPFPRSGTQSQPDSQPVTVPFMQQSIRANKARFDQLVAEVALTHGIDGALLHAVISVESRYNPNAVSRSGAIGLMQLMPATAKRYGVSDSFDPEQNLHGGAKYLRDLLTLFNSDINLALAAYNAGENAVIRNGNRIPPYRETRNYVPRVMGYYRLYQVRL